MTKPGGTLRPILVISQRLAPLPPRSILFLPSPSSKAKTYFDCAIITSPQKALNKFSNNTKSAGVRRGTVAVAALYFLDYQSKGAHSHSIVSGGLDRKSV